MFVLGDMIVFALFFTVYLYYRAPEAALFAASQRRLDTGLGVTNTLLLLTSSWFVVMGVAAVRADDGHRARRMLLAAAACGIGFVAVKVAEYAHKIGAGITLVTDHFFMYYFMFTGIHLVHVVLGIGVLLMLARRAATADAADARSFENGATFWHMVDLLWIMLFPLLYLVR